ncbi:MAG TPA: alpha/beta hydrolase, partial [Burkholderiales bacterium]|nr:alpha/beta hydrolase [Burkholderiales bacterium]
MSLFRPSVLPYLKSWFKIKPQDEIKKLKCPILIINGTKDMQVAEKNAQSLKDANPQATLLIV